MTDRMKAVEAPRLSATVLTATAQSVTDKPIITAGSVVEVLCATITSTGMMAVPSASPGKDSQSGE